MNSEQRTEEQKAFLLRILYWVVILAIVYVVFKYLLNLVMPFFIATVFAALVRPISRWLANPIRWKRNEKGEKVQVKRRVQISTTLAGILSVLVLFLLLAGVLVLIFIRLADTVTAIVSTAPDFYYNTVVPGFNEAFAKLESFAARFDDSVLAAVQNAVPNIISSIGTAVTGFSAKVVAWISSVATRVPSMLLSTIICLIATVFISVDFERIAAFIRRNLPKKTMDMVVNIRESFLDTIWQFIRSYFIIFCITAAEITVGLLIIGMDNALLLGCLIAVFDAFPIVGSGMILLPWTILTMVLGDVWRGVGLGVVYAVVVIARQVLEPKIVGKHVGLRPVVTLVCMYVGTKLFGGLGLFGLPITAAILVDLNDNGVIHLFKRPEPVAAPASVSEGGNMS